MSKAWQGGSTRAWRRTRAAVLARDGGVCRVRVPGVCTGLAECVHHIHGRAMTGDDPAYLTASCTACNLHIGEPGRDPAPIPRTLW
jgi:hypothetical protein